MRILPALILSVLALVTAESPPASPPRAPGDASKRPALLRRRSGVIDAASATHAVSVGPESEAEEQDADVEEQDTDEAIETDSIEEVEEPKGGLAAMWEQFGTLALVLIVRVVITFLRPMLARRGASAEGDAATSPLDAVGKALEASPLGGLLRMAQKGVDAVATLARSPQAAPVMMGLLILGVRLLKRSESFNLEEELVASTEDTDADAAAPEVTDTEEVDVVDAEYDEEEEDGGEGSEDEQADEDES